MSPGRGLQLSSYKLIPEKVRFLYRELVPLKLALTKYRLSLCNPTLQGNKISNIIGTHAKYCKVKLHLEKERFPLNYKLKEIRTGIGRTQKTTCFCDGLFHT